jgi:ABC-type amino acid transport substrate-binding protein
MSFRPLSPAWLHVPLVYLCLCLHVKAIGETYIIGSEDIDYYPHYRFTDSAIDKGFAWAVFNEFAKQSGHKFSYRSYPIKRLRREVLAKSIDFIYPDNPKWTPSAALRTNKTFSSAIITAIGSTLVLAGREARGLDDFTSLSLPRGFNPVKWAELIAQDKVHAIEVHNARAALQLVINGRVDGADVELNVANYLLQQMGEAQSLKFAPDLPYDPVTFHLSTIKYPQVILQFNHFIEDNQPLLRELRQQYGIIEPDEIALQKQGTLEPTP